MMVWGSSASLNNARASKWLFLTTVAARFQFALHNHRATQRVGFEEFSPRNYFLKRLAWIEEIQSFRGEGYCERARQQFWHPGVDQSQNARIVADGRTIKQTTL
jgi:hypothetical protein